MDSVIDNRFFFLLWIFEEAQFVIITITSIMNTSPIHSPRHHHPIENM